MFPEDLLIYSNGLQSNVSYVVAKFHRIMIGMSNGWASSNQKYCYQTLLNIEIDSFDHHHYLYIGIDDNVYGEHQSVIPGHTQLNSSSNRITPFCKDASVKNFPGNLLPNVFFFTLDVITFIIFFLKE